MLKAYYNENDPGAAAWLRELIAHGLIADGDVDERSIVDVKPRDLDGYGQCHFFAGIGGWSRALRLAGVPDDRPVWTGSCPCQPFSSAGKGLGYDDERNLWWSWFHLVAQCRPTEVYGEQVASKDGLLWWFDLVQPDLQATNYITVAQDRCGASVGAPHIRQRLYFAGILADVFGSGRRQAGRHATGDRTANVRETRNRSRHDSANDAAERLVGMADADGRQRNGESNAEGRYVSDWQNTGRSEGIGGPAARGEHGILADAASGRHQSRSRDTGICVPYNGAEEPTKQLRTARTSGIVGNPDSQDVRRRSAESDRPQGGVGHRLQGDSTRASGRVSEGLEHTASIGRGKRRAEPDGRRVMPGCAPVRASADNNFWSDADWLWCRDGKWRPVEPGTFPLADGIPERVGLLRGYGNAIIPQVAAGFIQDVMSC